MSVSKPTLSRELRELGYRKLSARPRHHAQDPEAIEAFKERGSAAKLDKVRASLPRGTPIEIWFQDEARIGQKNKITRRWARRGTRPSAPHDQRTRSAYILGAICPEEGKAAGLVLPFCNTETMGLHLAEISLAVAPGAHAVLFMDQAGWHGTGKLDVAANITIVPLPSRSPELNPRKTSGRSCATIGSQTVFSSLTKTSSTITGTPGTSSLNSPGASCPLDSAIGHTGSDQ